MGYYEGCTCTDHNCLCDSATSVLIKCLFPTQKLNVQCSRRLYTHSVYMHRYLELNLSEGYKYLHITLKYLYILLVVKIDVCLPLLATLLWNFVYERFSEDLT